MRVRAKALMFALGATSLAACARPSVQDDQLAHAPTLAPVRKAGLWEQTLMRDGKPANHASMRVCLGDAADDRLWVFDKRMQSERCQRQITRASDGSYHFSSSCRLGPRAVVSATGVASGDFSSAYTVRSAVSVSGAPFAELDGAHEVELVSRYRGPCPSDMAPGQIALDHGMRIKPHRLPALAAAFVGA
jgi:hypothetical protein